MQDIFIQSKVIYIFPKWRPPPSWIFSLCKFGHFCVFVVWYLCSVPNLVQIFFIIIHWDRRTYASDVHLMTSRELTSGFDIWSRDHLRMASTHIPVKYGADIFIQSRVRHFSEMQDGGGRHLGFSGYVNLAIAACWQCDFNIFCSVPNFVQISIIVTEIDRRMMYLSEIHLMTSCELTSGFDIWSRCHSAWPWCVFV